MNTLEEDANSTQKGSWPQGDWNPEPFRPHPNMFTEGYLALHLQFSSSHQLYSPIRVAIIRPLLQICVSNPNTPISNLPFQEKVVGTSYWTTSIGIYYLRCFTQV